MKNLYLRLRERRPRSRLPANSQLPGKNEFLSQNPSPAEHLLVLVVSSPSNQFYVVLMKPWHRY
jgi:hypothetical protein